VILSDDDGTAGIATNQDRGIDELSGTNNNLHLDPRKCPPPPNGMDNPRSDPRKCPHLSNGKDYSDPRKCPSMADETYCRKASNDKCLGTESIPIEVQEQGRFSSIGTQARRVDSESYAYSTCFDDRGISSKFDSVQDRSIRPEDPDKRGSFSGRNPVSGRDLSFEQSGSYACDRSMFSNSERLDFVREQKQPETNIREHHLGLGVEFELLPDRFRSPDERPLLNFDKDWLKKSHNTPLPRKLWPDEEPPEPPKRFRTSLPAADLPSAEKPPSSNPSGLPVERTFCAVDYSMPGSSVYRSKAVSLMQSEEGLHVITEEMVAHTIYDDLPESGIENLTSKTQNNERCYHNAKAWRDGTKPASFTDNRPTTSLPDRPGNKRSYDRIHEILLSPNPHSKTVVHREPSKTSCLVGGTDRADIAGGWKPLSGQTIVRKPPKPSLNSVRDPLAGTGKPPKHSVDSLFSSFDSASRKSGSHTQLVLGRDGISGIAKRDREPILAQSASLSTTRSVVDKKSGNSANNSRLDMAKTSSSGARPESVGVQNIAQRSNSGYQRTASKPAELVKYVAEPPSGNGNEPLPEFDIGGSENSRPFRASSSDKRIESAEVQNTERTRNLDEGDSIGVDRPSRNGSRSLNRPGDLGFSDSRHGLPRKSYFGERVESDSVQIMEMKKSSGHGKDGHKDVVSKWNKFQETAPTHQPRQPQVHSTSSNLVDSTAKQHSFQMATPSPVSTPQPVSSTPIQIISCSPIQAQTSGSDLVRTTTLNSSLVRPTVSSKKPEVACVTPQVRQPLRALHLDQDTSGISHAENGAYHICLTLPSFVLS